MQQAKCRRVRWRGGQDAWGGQAFSYIAGIAEGFASSSRSVPAAVRLDDLTVDPAAPGAGQERDHARDVVGLTKTAERDVIRQALDQLFRRPLRNNSVATGPGATALTVTPPKYSCALLLL
jgi:hypothetical protein